MPVLLDDISLVPIYIDGIPHEQHIVTEFTMPLLIESRIRRVISMVDFQVYDVVALEHRYNKTYVWLEDDSRVHVSQVRLLIPKPYKYNQN